MITACGVATAPAGVAALRGPGLILGCQVVGVATIPTVTDNDDEFDLDHFGVDPKPGCCNARHFPEPEGVGIYSSEPRPTLLIMRAERAPGPIVGSVSPDDPVFEVSFGSRCDGMDDVPRVNVATRRSPGTCAIRISARCWHGPEP
jgi:hypothetical protein